MEFHKYQNFNQNSWLVPHFQAAETWIWVINFNWNLTRFQSLTHFVLQTVKYRKDLSCQSEQLLWLLQTTITWKHPSMFTGAPIRLHYTHPCVYGPSVQDMLHSMHLKVSVHSSYDLDFTQCDFCVFISIKEFLKDHRFTWSKDVYATVVQWFQQEHVELFWRGPISWYVNPL